MNRLSNRFEQALNYATRLHANQVRKGGTVPYISHLISVAALVLEDGGDEDAAIAALLHDAVEDQGATRSEIQSRFGDRVLQIVDACTESDQIPKPPWKQRKLQAIDRLRQAEPDVQRVMVADRLHNLRSIWADWQRQGDRVWERFNADRTAVLWFYADCVAAVRDPSGDRDSATHNRAAASDRFDSPMVAELQTLLEDV